MLMKISLPIDAWLLVNVRVSRQRGRGVEWKGDESGIGGRQLRYKKPPRPMDESHEHDLTLHSVIDNWQSGESGKYNTPPVVEEETQLVKLEEAMERENGR